MNVRIALGLLFLLPVNSVFAADDNWPKFEVRLGAVLTDFDSELRIDSFDNIRGSDTDLEGELNIEDALEEFRLDLRWRFRPRHSLDFAYYDISRTGRRIIDRELSIGDETYLIGTNISSTLGFEVYKLAYAYSFSQSEKSDASVSLGVHAIDFGFEAKGRLLNLPVNRHTSEVVLPLPVVGLEYSRRLGGPFSVNIDVDLFALEYGDYKGNLWDANLTLDVDFTEKLGGFIGYNYVDMGLESEDEDLIGKVNYQYSAVNVGVRLRF